MRVDLYVADDIQQLQSGKLMAVGLYADRVVVLNPAKGAAAVSPDRPAVIQALFLLAAVSGLPAGKHRVGLAVVAPNSAPTKYLVPESETDIKEGGSINLGLKCVPFVADEVGRYRVLMTVDGEKIESEFELRLGSPAEDKADQEGIG